jgi:hypothetical protein
MEVCGLLFRIGLLRTMRIMLHAPTVVMTFDVTFSLRKPPTPGARVGASDRLKLKQERKPQHGVPAGRPILFSQLESGDPQRLAPFAP